MDRLMRAYLIANLRVHDASRFAEYRERVAPMIRHSGADAWCAAER